MVANNINKSTSAKILQPEPETGFKLPESPPIFSFGLSDLVKEPQSAHEKATVGAQLWPFYKLVWALSGPFSGLFVCQ